MHGAFLNNTMKQNSRCSQKMVIDSNSISLPERESEKDMLNKQTALASFWSDDLIVARVTVFFIAFDIHNE